MAFKTKLAEHEIQLGTRQYRIYPEGEQIAWIWQLFGANRFVWNQFVATFEARYEANPELKFPKISVLKSWLPLMRKEHEWLKRVNSTSLQFTVERFSDAMWAFLTKKNKLSKASPDLKAVSIILKLPRLKMLNIRPRLVLKLRLQCLVRTT